MSGNNNTTATYEISVENVSRHPVIVNHTGHSIGGNNYFADGGNYFAGSNTIEELSIAKLSVGFD